LIDIVNAKAEKKFESLGCQSTPEYLEHLLKTIKTFREWKSEAGEEKTHFIPDSCYQDLLWVCFSILGLAKTHLGDSGTHEVKRLAQSLLGSDVCEFRFCASKARNARKKIDFDYAMVKADTSDVNRAFNLKDKGNARFGAIRTEDLIAPLPKRNKITHKQRSL
jgi:hypothetical protein